MSCFILVFPNGVDLTTLKRKKIEVKWSSFASVIRRKSVDLYGFCGIWHIFTAKDKSGTVQEKRIKIFQEVSIGSKKCGRVSYCRKKYNPEQTKGIFGPKRFG